MELIFQDHELLWFQTVAVTQVFAAAVTPCAINEEECRLASVPAFMAQQRKKKRIL